MAKSYLLIAILVLAVSSQGVVESKLTQSDYANQLYGFLFAFEVAEEVETLFQCKGDVPHMISSVGQAKNLFRLGGVDNVVQGIQQFVAQVELVVKYCGKTTIEAKNYLLKMRNIVRDPKFPPTAEKNLFKHFSRVADNLAAYKQASDSGDNFKAGFKIGEIARIAFFNELSPL